MVVWIINKKRQMPMKRPYLIVDPEDPVFAEVK
jgi:hypothetical protein